MTKKIQTQGTSSRYARRKQRASTKVRAAAGVAVKPATACHVFARFFGKMDKKLIMDTPVKICYSKTLI